MLSLDKTIEKLQKEDYSSFTLESAVSMVQNNKIQKSAGLALIALLVQEEYAKWKKLDHFSEAPVSFVVEVIETFSRGSTYSMKDLDSIIVNTAKSRGATDQRFYEIGLETKFRGVGIKDYLIALLTQTLTEFVKADTHIDALTHFSNRENVKQSICTTAIQMVQDAESV